MTSQWDLQYGGSPEELEAWLYGTKSLKGATRDWFLERARQWPAGTRLLDAGCGGGVTAYQLEAKGLLNVLDYTGIDGSSAMLVLARRKVSGPARWIQKDLSKVALEPEYDKILLRAVIEHHYDPTPIVRNVIAGLRPQGELIIIFWNNPVAGKTVHYRTERGFPDNAHSERVLKDILHSCSLAIAETQRVAETSARGEPFRTVWIARRVSPGGAAATPQ